MRIFFIAIASATIAAGVTLDEKGRGVERNSLDVLVRRLRSPDEEVRDAAATSLQRLGPKAVAAVPALIEALGDTDQGVRACAANCLGFIGPQAKAGIPALYRVLIDKNEVETVRSWAALSLGWIGPDALHVLIEALKPGTDALIRRNAAYAIGKIGPRAEPAIPHLVIALADQDEKIWSAARQSLVAIGRVGLPRLRGALDVKDPPLRGRAGRTILEIEPKDLPTIQAMIADLRDPNPHVRRDAALALEHAIPDAAAEAVQALAESLKDNDVVVRELAARDLYSMGRGAHKALPSLIAAMGDSDAQVRGYSALALGNIGARSGRAVEVLISVVDDLDPDVRILVVRALGNIGSSAAAAAPKLKAILLEANLQDQLRFETERSLEAILKSPQ